MARKPPSPPGKRWSPGDPLRFDQAIVRGSLEEHIAEQQRADELRPPRDANQKQAITPTNHKPFNRQKKG